MSRYLEYEDAGILLHDKLSSSYMAVSPNLDQISLKAAPTLSLYNYSPESCLSLQFLKSGKFSQLILNPREERLFLEGVDNLSPVGIF